MKLYDEFEDVCKKFDTFVQEERWSNVVNFVEFTDYVNKEYEFWKRLISLIQPSKKMLEEFEWFEACCKQMVSKIQNEKINKKIRFICKKQNIKDLFE
jgi:hypothetical protein